MQLFCKQQVVGAEPTAGTTSVPACYVCQMTSLHNRQFRIQLDKRWYLEHENALLRQHDGRVCTLKEQLKGSLWVTDTPVSETENTDYTHDGFLVVKVDQDGIFLDA